MFVHNIDCIDQIAFFHTKVINIDHSKFCLCSLEINHKMNSVDTKSTCMQAYKLYAGLCNSMQAYGTACKLMLLHASLCNCMQSYVTACILLQLIFCTDLYKFVILLQCCTDLYNVVQTCKCKTVMFPPCMHSQQLHACTDLYNFVHTCTMLYRLVSVRL